MNSPYSQQPPIDRVDLAENVPHPAVTTSTTPRRIQKGYYLATTSVSSTFPRIYPRSKTALSLHVQPEKLPVVTNCVVRTGQITVFFHSR